MTLNKDQSELAACALRIVATRWAEDAARGGVVLGPHYRQAAANARALAKLLDPPADGKPT